MIIQNVAAEPKQLELRKYYRKKLYVTLYLDIPKPEIFKIASLVERYNDVKWWITNRWIFPSGIVPSGWVFYPN